MAMFAVFCVGFPRGGSQLCGVEEESATFKVGGKRRCSVDMGPGGGDYMEIQRQVMDPLGLSPVQWVGYGNGFGGLTRSIVLTQSGVWDGIKMGHKSLITGQGD